jgi:putative ABC transport system permease protein
MTSLLADIRYGLRVLLKSRSYTAVAVVTLAVGIGVTTAIFSMADAIMFHPYPFKDLDRIVDLGETIPKVSTERYGVSPGNYLDWKEKSRALRQMAAYRPWDATLTGAHNPEQVRVYLVSSDFFPLLGMAPRRGRVFSEQENEENRNQVLVSYGFWQQRLGGDSNVLGKPLTLNGLTYTVIGVMPQDFDFPMYAEMWAPWIAAPEARSERTRHELGVIARLASGVPLHQARAEMDNIGARLARDYPLSNAGRRVGVVLLRDSVDEYAGRFMMIVTAAVAFLLLLACANVANLQLARGSARRRELALRIALGAGRWRIARQLLAEGILLSALGAGLGLPLAVWGLAAIKARMPQIVSRHLPGLTHAQLDARMLAFAVAATLFTGVASTLPAMLQAWSERLHETLKEGGRGSLAPGWRWMREAMVVFEIAFAIVLLIGAGLLVEGFKNLARLNQGFDSAHVVTFNINLPDSKYREGHQVVNFYQELLRRLNAIPGNGPAAVTSELPALGDGRSRPIEIEGQPAASPERPLLSEVRITSEEYFRTLAIPIHAGRGFNSADREGALPVAVVSSSAAQRLWPGQNAMGGRLKVTSGELGTPWLTVVGIVGDVKHFFLDSEVRPIIYLPYQQQPVRSLNVVLRTGMPLDRTALAVRAAVRNVDAAQAPYAVESLNRFFADLAGGVGIVASLVGIFAVIALAMSVAGVYAVMAYSVARRTQEIGIRMALGAQAADVRKLIAGNALKLLGTGLAAGLPVSLALGRIMSGALPGLVILNPFIVAGFTAVLAASALVASYVPARRASQVDPLVALRRD